MDDVSVETLDTLVMTVDGLQRPRQARVRVSYAGETSPVVRGEDVVPEDATLPPPPAETTTEGRSDREGWRRLQGRWRRLMVCWLGGGGREKGWESTLCWS